MTDSVYFVDIAETSTVPSVQHSKDPIAQRTPRPKTFVTCQYVSHSSVFVEETAWSEVAPVTVAYLWGRPEFCRNFDGANYHEAFKSTNSRAGRYVASPPVSGFLHLKSASRSWNLILYVLGFVTS